MDGEAFSDHGAVPGGVAAAATLADYAAGLRADDVPPGVLRRAKDVLSDTVAAAIYGHRAPAGRIVARQILAQDGSGRCHVLGAAGAVRAEDAALANGVLAHALELDSLRKPGAGVHPGAVLVPAALAVAQERGSNGRALLAALVAGCEVLCRVGRATKHSAESRGFHAPGLTGPFGAAVTAAHLMGLDAAATRQALGIAGSLGGGLLEFAASGDGGMVKRLHLGRAAQAGITAARLAADGFTGPARVLEGRYGFLNAYCADTDPAALTAGLGERWETLTVCLKRYACHVTAHTPVFAIEELRAAHGFDGTAVASVLVEGAPKMAHLHADRAPRDLVAAQYSIASCVAVGLLRDPLNPDSFTGNAWQDPAVRDLCARVEVRGTGGFASSWATRTTLRLHDGREFVREGDDFPGTPSLPLDAAGMARKFASLTRSLGARAAPLLARLERIEEEPALDWLGAAACPS